VHRFIPALASSVGTKISEIPITNLERKSGKSHYGIGRTIRVFLDLIMVKRFRLDWPNGSETQSAGPDFRETLGKILPCRSARPIAPLAPSFVALSTLGKQVRQQLPVSEPRVENSS
jgi:hypothetical protein